MIGTVAAVVCGVISTSVSLLALGGAMQYEEKRRMNDLYWTLGFLAVALALAFLSGWAARGGG